MVELHPGGDARLRFVEVAVGGPAGGLLAQRDETRGGENGHVARPEVLGGVLGTDGQLELRAQPGVRAVSGRGRGLGWFDGHDDYDTAVTDTALIDPDVLERVLSTALVGGGDMAEVFAEDAVSSSALLDDHRVEQLSSGRSRGAGIRVVDGDTTGFAHTADLSEAGLVAAARAAAAVALQGGNGVRTVALDPLTSHGRGGRTPPDSVEKERKLELLTRADETARAAGDAITQVQVGCGDSRRRILIANSDGLLAQDEQIRTRFSVSCVANGDTGMQTGFESLARTEGYEIFERHRVEDIAEAAAVRALAKLSARPAPSGEVPIVLAGGSGGILFHEACGHGLEADHILKDASVYAGQVGELVASPLVTLVDDGTVLGEWGNFAVDDEGCLPARNVLIENGVLTDYMWDWLRGAQGGPEVLGQRAPPELRPSADGADDEHLPARRDRGSRGDRGADRFGGLREEARRRAGQYGHGRLRLRDDGGVPDRGRPHHRTAARRQPHRERAGRAPSHRRGGHRLRHDAGNLWQGRAECPGRLRAGDAAHHRRHPRGHGVTDELLHLAQSVVAEAAPGEGMEVYVTRGTDTEVRAYEGEVESLTSADSSGVGIRVVLGDADAGGSQVGFAWAGSLAPDVIAATLADARDNARFATPDPDVVLAAPDGVEAVDLDLWDDGVGATPMEKKVALAIELERATRAADPRIRQVSSADYSDSRVEVALASTTGIVSSRRRTNAFLSVDAIAGEGAETQTGTGFSIGRGPGELVPDEAMDDAVLRATRMVGAQKVRSAHCTVVFDPRVVSTLLGVIASALSGEAVVKGRSFFAGRIGETIATGGITLVDDPTDARAYRRVVA